MPLYVKDLGSLIENQFTLEYDTVTFSKITAELAYQKLEKLPVKHSWLNLEILKAAFIFPNNFYKYEKNIDINTLGSHTLYQLHQQAWKDQQGLN